MLHRLNAIEIQGKRGATGGAGPISPHGQKGGDISPSGGAGVK